VKFNRLLKNAHLRRFPLPSSLRRTLKYASLLRISGALHLCIFDQPGKNNFFNNRLDFPFPNPDKPEPELTAKTKKETKKIEFGTRFD